MMEKILIFENNQISIEVKSRKNWISIGRFFLKSDNNLLYCGDGIKFLFKNETIYFDDFEQKTDQYGGSILSLSNSKNNITVNLIFRNKISENLIEIACLSTNRNLKRFKIEIFSNFNKQNSVNYCALSGSFYRVIRPADVIEHEVNHIGAFSGIWTISSPEASLSLISTSQTHLKLFRFIKNYKRTILSVQSDLKKENMIQIFIYLGRDDYIKPIKLKFQNLESIKPLQFPKNFKDKASKAFFTLKSLFCHSGADGIVPANFIHYPYKKHDKFIKSPMASYGSCFSMGAIYGTSALYLWMKNKDIVQTLIKFINPVLEHAQLKTGHAKGAFFDTYYHPIRKWTTGRVVYKEGGFSEWIPYKNFPEKLGTMDGYSLKDNLRMLKREILIKTWFKYIWSQRSFAFSSTNPKPKLKKPIIFPPFTGQFAYFLLQVLLESQDNG
ncbi:MAG: hypothetical protein GF353_14425, partial [Candidatus Lokiarchaeota archaeon]|nr:hypothetical protein [Candidatus Lokiarchaeota archaeon]